MTIRYEISTIKSLDVCCIQEVRMAYFYRSVFLFVKWGFEISVFWHLEATEVVLIAAGASAWFIATQLRTSLEFSSLCLLLFSELGLRSRPFQLESVILHLPSVSPTRFNYFIKLDFRIADFRLTSINISLLDILERSACVIEHRCLTFVVSEVMSLGSGHPIRDIFTVFTKSMVKYLELMKNFFLYMATSELYLGAVLPRLALNPLLCLAREPTLIRELYIFYLMTFLINFILKRISRCCH